MKNILWLESIKWLKDISATFAALNLSLSTAIVVGIVVIILKWIDWHYTYKMRDYLDEVNGKHKIFTKKPPSE